MIIKVFRQVKKLLIPMQLKELYDEVENDREVV